MSLQTFLALAAAALAALYFLRDLLPRRGHGCGCGTRSCPVARDRRA